MTKEQEIFKKINILLYQIIESIKDGELSYLKKGTDEIDILIDELKN